MTLLLRNFIIYFAVILGNVSTSSATDQPGMNPVLGKINLAIKNDLLWLQAHNAPLDVVIHEIGESAGFKTILTADFIDPPLVNVSFEAITIRQAVEKLVSDKNRIILYAPQLNGSQQPVISQVWLMGKSDGHSQGSVSHREPAAPALEKLVKEHKLAKLTRLIQPDQDALIRMRAAIALGNSGDQSAVYVLESALLDEDALVRLEIIKALSRISSERATLVLGGILLNPNIDKIERIMAARALNKQNSDAARNYLRLAASDSDGEVRSASRNPLLPTKTSTSTF